MRRTEHVSLCNHVTHSPFGCGFAALCARCTAIARLARTPRGFSVRRSNRSGAMHAEENAPVFSLRASRLCGLMGLPLPVAAPPRCALLRHPRQILRLTFLTV